MKNKNVDNKVAVSPSVPLIGSAYAAHFTRSGKRMKTKKQRFIEAAQKHGNLFNRRNEIKLKILNLNSELRKIEIEMRQAQDLMSKTESKPNG